MERAHGEAHRQPAAVRPASPAAIARPAPPPAVRTRERRELGGARRRRSATSPPARSNPSRAARVRRRRSRPPASGAPAGARHACRFDVARLVHCGHLTVYLPSASGKANPRIDQSSRAARLSIDLPANTGRLDRGRPRRSRRPTRSSSRIRSIAGACGSRSRQAGGGRARARARPAYRPAPLSPALARRRGAGPVRLRGCASPCAQAVAAGTLVPREDGGFGLDWRDDEPRACASPSPPTRWPCSPTPPASPACTAAPGAATAGWVFLDLSGRRRWCSMADLRQPGEDAADVRARKRARALSRRCSCSG